MAEQPVIAHDALAMTTYDQGAAVLVLSDSGEGTRRASATVAAAGGRVASVAPIDRGLDQIDRHVRLGAIWVEAEEDRGDAFDRLLERLDLESAAHRLGAVVSGPQALIDVIAAATPRHAVAHLCEASDEQRIEALRAALGPNEARLHDVNRGATPRLQQISEEVGRIANLLAELSEDEDLQSAPALDRTEIAPATIRAIIRARRLREKFFGAELFADPAWDMMLDLMAARLERRQVAVSSLCIAAAVPPTTALRWIKTLTEAGVFARTADPQDGRRIYVELTEATAAAFQAYLTALPAAGMLVI